MTAKKAATSAKHKTATKKHAASAKHTETKAQLAHLHVLHVEHEAHLAHMAAIGQKVTTKAKPAAHAKAAKKVSFAVGDWLPVCGFEAVAQSLRLIGQRVDDDEVLRLYDLCGSREASIGEALTAAALFGLAGCRPGFNLVGDLGERRGDLARLGSGEVVDARFVLRPEHLDGGAVDVGDAPELAQLGRVVRSGGASHGLILHVDVPGPHAVLATRDGWWSWGELHDPWRCNVLEAWAVAW